MLLDNLRVYDLQIRYSNPMFHLCDLPWELFDFFFNCFVPTYSAGARPTEEELQRIDCGPEGTDLETCLTKGCLWSESNSTGVPWCYINRYVVQSSDMKDVAGVEIILRFC